MFKKKVILPILTPILSLSFDFCDFIAFLWSLDVLLAVCNAALFVSLTQIIKTETCSQEINVF